jgi:maleate isomerase
VSGTNIATYDVIAPLEAELRKPVVTANQVTMWALLGAIGRQAVGPHQWLLSGPRVQSDPV